MEYQVPQFIEVEDKIVGPLTLKQFIYVAGGAGLCLIFFFELPLIFAVLLSLPVIALAGALAFYKMNGKPLIALVEAGFNYYVGPKLFLWKHEEAPAKGGSASGGKANMKPVPAAARAQTGPRLTRGKLSELAWSLDIKKGPPTLSSQS